MKQHKVRDGECLTSIAAHYGFSVDMLWDLSDNSSLKDKRKDPNTLVPGDVVSIPDRREKVVSCETAKTHRFKLTAPSAILRLQLLKMKRHWRIQDFELKIGDKSYPGKTDGEGLLEVTIPCDATEGVLTIGPSHKGKSSICGSGYLQPIGETPGVHKPG